MRRFERLAIILLLAAAVFVIAILTPRTALGNFQSPESVATNLALLTLASLLLLRVLPARQLSLERALYALFLAAMPHVYLAAALLSGGVRDMAVLLGIGILAHGLLWDSWHHNPSGYIAVWYADACLVLDLAVGLLALSQHAARQ